MANPIASLFAEIGFRYNKRHLQQFQKDLKQTAAQINSRSSGSIGGATKEAKGEQSKFYTEIRQGYGKVKPKLIEHQKNLKLLRQHIQDNTISTKEYRDARSRVLSAINTKEKRIHRERIARFRKEQQMAGPYSGGKDPRQAGDHRLISAIHSDVGLGAMVGGFAAAQSTRAYQEYIGAQQGISAAMGGAEQGQQEFQWLINKSNELGISLTAAADGYKGLAAATKGSNLEGKETRRIFEAVASYSKVLNLSLDDQKGVFRA